MALFAKNKKEKSKAKAAEGEPRLRREELHDVKVEETADLSSESLLKEEALAKAGARTHRILRGFYVSEKASLGQGDNQYVFRVFNNANKSEVKKEVSRLFNVKVKSVKVLNMPEKRRDFGRHPGAKSGFKKAIVVLEKGHVIGQAR